MTAFGPYQLIRRLGAGATAEVFLAEGPTPAGPGLVAVKLILPHLANDGGHRALLLREARAVSLLRHPNVVQLYDVGEVEGRTFLAMEYVAGFPLNALVRALREPGERLGVAEAAHAVREAALGVHHAHEATDPEGQPLGLVHRDVSPHNLMLSGDGHVKVVDFGLARATHATATQTGGLKGKLRYMPPEQLRSEPLDRRVDLFALGAILWELTLGAPLYPGPTEADIFQQALFDPLPHPDEVARGLPRAFVEVLVRAVDRQPARRYQTAEAMAAALQPFVTAGARDALAKTVVRLLGRAPATAEEAARDAGRMELARPQTGSYSTLSESIVPPQVGARAPLPPASPRNTPQEARLAPPLSPFPKIARGHGVPRAAKKAAAPSTWPSPSRDTEPGGAASPQRRSGLKEATSTLVRQWRRKEWLKWGAIALVAAVVGAGSVALLRARVRTQQKSLPAVPAAVIAAQVEASAPPGAVAARGADAAPGAVAAPAAPKPPAAPLIRERPRPAPAAAPIVRRGRGRGTLVLTADRPALVTVGERRYGMTPLTVELAAGRHRVQLRSMDGGRGASFEVTLQKDAVVERQVALEPL